MSRGLSAWLALVVALSLSVVGCQQQGPCAEGPAVVDTQLLAYLSKARALHREADLAETNDDPRAAVAAMERLFATEVPGPSQEIDEVRADSHARMAELLAGTGDFDRAKKHVDQGLTLTPGPSYFRGHLLEVRGLVEEKLAKSLRDKGDKEGARAAGKRAVEASEEAIRVLDEIIKTKAPSPKGSR